MTNSAIGWLNSRITKNTRKHNKEIISLSSYIGGRDQLDILIRFLFNDNIDKSIKIDQNIFINFLHCSSFLGIRNKILTN